MVRGLHVQLSCALQWREENKKESDTAALNGDKVAKSKVEAWRKKTAARLECMGQATRGHLVSLGVVVVGGGGIDENAAPDRLQVTKRRHANAATGSWGNSAP